MTAHGATPGDGPPESGGASEGQSRGPHPAESALARDRDLASQALAPYRDLKDRDLAREGLFIGETLLVVEAMLARPGLTRSVLASERMAARVREAIASSASPATPLLVLPEAEIEAIAGFRVHRGVLAAGCRAAVEGSDAAALVASLPSRATVLACDGITNIDNIGILFRVAAAFGVSAVLLSPDCHDPLWRKSLRVSIGHALRIPWARCEDLAETLRAMRDGGWSVFGASLDPAATPLGELTAPSRGVLVVGHESKGISREVAAACTRLVRIPMAPGTDSLNVGVAAAVCLNALSVGERN